VLTRQVQAIAGFRWGFTISGDDISLTRAAAVSTEAWDSHLDVLRTGYPEWTFDAGYLADGSSR
jgi:hypothetical protein